MVFYNICALFSGCGGLDYGFLLYNKELEKLNKKNLFKIVWANDDNNAACRSYSKNFSVELLENQSQKGISGEVIACGDIRKIDFKRALGKEKIDIILGGFPCQDFSVLRGDRENKGIKVKRGQLYLDYVRSLYILEPKLFIAENVAGLVSANKGAAYKKIIDDFSNITSAWKEIVNEYDVLYKYNNIKDKQIEYDILFSKVIDFSRLGVPQRRKRLIIIGLRGDLSKKLRERGILDELKQNIDDYLSGKDSIFKKFPLTPIEVFEGKTLINLSEKYKKILKEYEKNIIEIQSERKVIYYETIWKKYSFDIIKDYIWLNNNKNSKKKRKPTAEKSKLNIEKNFTIEKWIQNKNSNQKIDKWVDIQNEYSTIINEDLSSLTSTDIDNIMKAHEEVLKELGYFNTPIHKHRFDDNSHVLLKDGAHIIERMKYIPPYENFSFVQGTEFQVKGLMSNIYRRIHPLIPSTTIIGRGGGGTWGYHYKQSRQRLTHRERARLQTFSDEFDFCGISSEIRAQIGNAVPPLAGKRIAKIIYQILEQIEKS